MMHKVSNTNPILGGTCSDRTLHFREILLSHNYEVRLHSSFINGKETHRLLKVKVDGHYYFVDVGIGWPTIKPLPISYETEYECCGLYFKSKIYGEEIIVSMKKDDFGYKEMCRIPLVGKSEELILEDINNRYNDVSIYPFSNELRYSIKNNNTFTFVRGEQKFEYKSHS